MAEEITEPQAKDAEAVVEPQAKKPGKLGALLGILVVTLVAGGAGGGLGIYLAGAIETTVAAKAAAEPADTPQLRYGGDATLLRLEPVVTNLADPGDTWIRLETSIVFQNGAVENPDVTAAEIRQDIMAFARTIPLSRLAGPSALQHLREDLNERVAIRTDGRVEELVIEAMVLQ